MKFLLLLTVVLGLGSNISFSDDDMSVYEACQLKITQEFDSKTADNLMEAAGEARKVNSEGLWHLDLDVIHCFVKYDSMNNIEFIKLENDEE